MAVNYRSPLPLKTQVFRFIPCFLLSVLFLAGALVITNGRMPDPQEVHPLPDMLFEVIPKIASLEMATDAIILTLTIIVAVILLKLYALELLEGSEPPLRVPIPFMLVSNFVNGVILAPIDSKKRPYSLEGCALIALIRFLTTYTVVMFFRAFVITMTSYPATDNHCQNPQSIDNPLLNMLLTLVTLGSGAIHCGDLMYSGHTIILTLNFWMMWEYGTFIHCFAFRIAAPLLVLTSFFSIIASRSHYTDDILVSAYITSATFLAIPHRDEGAPWQLQLPIRFWPCLGTNEKEDHILPVPGQEEELDDVVVLTPSQDIEGSTHIEKRSTNIDVDEELPKESFEN